MIVWRWIMNDYTNWGQDTNNRPVLIRFDNHMSDINILFLTY